MAADTAPDGLDGSRGDGGGSRVNTVWPAPAPHCSSAPDAGDNMTIPSGPMGATVVTTLHRGPPRSSHTDINNYRNYIRTLSSDV